jgi:tetrahydromethanopterin S-methyltransferase subunit B
MRGNAARALLLVVAVLALVSVVAIASTGSTNGGTDSVRAPSRTLLDTFFSLSLVVVIAGALLLLYGLTQRKAIAREVATGRYRRTGLAGSMLWISAAGLLGYWVLYGRKRPLEPPGEEQDPAFPEAEITPPMPDETAGEAYVAQFAWVPVAVVLGLVLVAVTAYVVAGRRDARVRPAEDDLAEQLAAVLDDTLDDVRAETDPRRAVIAAYARLERVLAANGLPRLESETPEELLRRVLRELSLDSNAVERLTALFARAKFSQHHVDLTMKEEAIGALEQVRDELRERSDPPESPLSPERIAAQGTAS